MASVTSRIAHIEQPSYGYLNPSLFKKIVIDDGIMLNKHENIAASLIGLAVDYLTRFMMGTDIIDSFIISLMGVKKAKKVNVAKELLKGINGLDDNSIINACKLVTFDVWYRNLPQAQTAIKYYDVNPDYATIHNIRVFVNRSIELLEGNGPVIKDGFDFKPDGYSNIVTKGDGDFLTEDTIWDLKVSKYHITKEHTLQLLMYWIMGQHSGQEIFKGITKLGIFNPRLNTVYLFEMKDLPEEVIKEVEDKVICYGGNEKID